MRPLSPYLGAALTLALLLAAATCAHAEEL
jgi:hypothetical protein